MSTVFLGVLTSTVILASGPIIVDTVINFALPYKLRSSFEENGIIYLTSYSNMGEIEYNDLNSQIHEYLTTNIREFEEIVHVIESPWLYPWQEGSLIPDERINLRSFDGIEDRIHFSVGEWPKNSNLEPNIIQAAIPKSMSDAYIIGVGDLLPVSKKNNDSTPAHWIEVSGIFQRNEAGDPFWLIEDNLFNLQNNSRYSAEFGVIIDKNDHYAITNNIFPKSNQQYKWLGIINPSRLKSDNLEDIVAGIEAIHKNLESFNHKFVLNTNLDKYLASYKTQSAGIIPPLYLLLGEVLFLGLYYVVMVAALAIRQVEGEFSILASRGAEINQLMRIQIFDASIICIISFIAGPLLANLIISSLASIGPLADINQFDWIARIPLASWKAAGMSILACFTALIIPSIPILQSSVVKHHQKLNRRSKTPWWHRYYLDVLLLIIGLIALWRLSLYGSISGVNQGKVDWLLLLAPLVLLIGSATVLLRLFPPFFSLLANIVSKGRGLTAAIALWNTSRDPTHVTRLILLFTLAIALGVLSTGLNATLTISEAERARHSSGGEVRLSFDDFIPLSELESIPQVNKTSAVWRGRGRANIRSYRNIPNFAILAIDPISFAAVSQFRTDYSDDYIGYVLGQLIVDKDQLPVSAIPLPDKPKHIGVWIADPFPARTQVNLLDYVEVRIKLQTSEGEVVILDLDADPNQHFSKDPESFSTDPEDSKINWYQFLSLLFHTSSELEAEKQAAPPQNPSWRYFDSPISEYTERGYPLSLHSIWIKIRKLPAESDSQTYSPGPLIIDDLSVWEPDNTQEIFEGFEELNTIWQTGDNLSVASYTRTDITHSGEASLRLYLGSADPSNWMILSPAQTTHENLIPILASPKFLELSGLKVGDKFSAFINSISLILEIKNSVYYFPTMYDTEDEGYVILFKDALLTELNLASRIPVNYNEIWMRVDEKNLSSDFQGMVPEVKREWEVESERIFMKSDPLTLGLRSVIFLGYSLTLLLSLVGFATYFFLSARKRASQYSILRSLGLSSSQLYGSLVFEQLILIVSGLILGLILGTVINKIILPGLPISFAEIPPIPPFVPKEDWISVFRLILIMLGGLLFTLAFGTLMLWRLRLHQILRAGEE